MRPATTTVPPAPRRSPRMPADVRREQALDAALALIARDGYGAVSMEAVAREMAVAKTVVYAAFGTRSDLLQALTAREEQHALGTLTAAMPTAENLSGERLLEAWVLRGLRAIQSAPATWRLVLLQTDDTPEPVRRRVEEGRTLVLAQVRELLQRLPVRGASGGDADLELLARGVLAIGEQAAALVLAEPDAFTPERYARFAVGLLRATQQP